MCRLSLCLVVVFTAALSARAADPNADGLQLFEAKVRPLLAKHCYQCHSTASKKQRGGLRLDARAAMLKGGDTGPAIVPGRPTESLLLRAVKHQAGELKMPPDGKLPPQAIAELERWIALGAPAPVGAAVVKGVDAEAARKHWAFQPVRKPAPPAVRHRDWARTPLDAFVLAKLEAAGLSPSPTASPRVLIRRLHFDLIGLPPTAAEVEAFECAVRRDGDAAVAALVDRLLASPHYGERWGRHWLDVARYADTKDGVLMYGEGRVRPYAYTYRDYVIRAFNADVPFDRFVHEQLAADQLDLKGEPWRLAAMGFLTLGRLFDNNVHDVIDDRIDTVSRGLLGLTVSCARCHDHKYDPIPTADYYSLYGVFASSEVPLELPLTVRLQDDPRYASFEKVAQAKRTDVRKFLDGQYAQLSEQTRQRVGDYLLRVATTEPDPLETAIYFLSLAPSDLRPQIVNRWRKHLENPARAADPVFAPWYALMKHAEADFARTAPATLAACLKRPAGTQPNQLNPLVRDALAKKPPRSRAELAKLYGGLLRAACDEAKKQPGTMSEPQRQLAERVTGHDSPSWFPRGHCWQYMSRSEKDRFGGMLSGLDVLAVKRNDAPPRAMVLVDAPQVQEPRIFVRGNPGRPGLRVPRQFLGVLSGVKRTPFTHGSGRLDLAHAITDPTNPLTARVLVNRVWMHHFGEPLVSTPSDFGLRTAPPTHPALLDWLAATFVEEGWSVKTLHRRIVLSSAYLQASRDRPECRKADPENRLLWRMNRRRLDFEAMRDAMLAVSGRLDGTMHGRPVDVAGDAANRRRTVYGLVDRQSLPGVFRTFDFAVPDQSVERRPQTTVPQQALFGLNGPFAIEQAKALAARAEAQAATVEARVEALYRLALARSPDALERDVALGFVREVGTTPGSRLTPWQQLAQVLLLTNEALFVD